MYYVFFIICCCLLLGTYLLKKGDVLEPGVLLCFLFVFSIIVSFYLYEYWHLYEYSGTTVKIIVLGISSFILGGLLFGRIKFRVRWSNNVSSLYKNIGQRHGSIKINKQIGLIICLISLGVLGYFFLCFTSSVSFAGTVAQVISGFKQIRLSENRVIPRLLNLLIKVLNSFAHICIFVFLNNRISKSKIRSDLWMLIPCCSYLIICLFSSNRGDMLIFAFNSFVAWYILYKRYSGWKQNVEIKVLLKGVRSAAIILFIFWLLLFVTHTSETSNDVNVEFMKYMCSYISGPLASFDLYIKQGGEVCRWFGEETFSALNNNVYSIFHVGVSSSRLLEFREGNGHSVVNIYTSFRRFYHDFGYFGVFLLSLIEGSITCNFYNYVKTKPYRYPVDMAMCIYSYFSYTVLYIVIDEMFYSSNISFSGLAKLIIFILSYKFIFINVSQETVINK